MAKQQPPNFKLRENQIYDLRQQKTINPDFQCRHHHPQEKNFSTKII